MTYKYLIDWEFHGDNYTKTESAILWLDKPMTITEIHHQEQLADLDAYPNHYHMRAFSLLADEEEAS